MPICKRDGCDEDAVAVQLVRTATDENDFRPLEEWCRPHHVEERRAAGVLVPVKVLTNRAAIMGVDGSENRRGAELELDSEEIRIDLLERLGYVQVLADTSTPASAGQSKAESLRQAAADAEDRAATLRKELAAAEKAAAKHAEDEAKEAAKVAAAAQKTADAKAAEAEQAKASAAAATGDAKPAEKAKA